MLRMVSGLMLIFLTACSGDDPAPVAAASLPPAAVAPVAPASAPPADLNITVLIDPHAKPPSKAEKLAAKTAATELLGVMLDLEQVVDDSNIMDDTFRYGRYFYQPIEARLGRWQKMRDASSSDVFGDLDYCSEAARTLSHLGAMVNAKGFAQQFIDERRDQYRAALPKCQRAIQQYK